MSNIHFITTLQIATSSLMPDKFQIAESYLAEFIKSENELIKSILTNLLGSEPTNEDYTDLLRSINIFATKGYELYFKTQYIGRVDFYETREVLQLCHIIKFTPSENINFNSL